MARKIEEKWMANYEALKAYIEEYGHLPDKHKIESKTLLSGTLCWTLHIGQNTKGRRSKKVR